MTVNPPLCSVCIHYGLMWLFYSPGGGGGRGVWEGVGLGVGVGECVGVGVGDDVVMARSDDDRHIDSARELLMHAW